MMKHALLGACALVLLALSPAYADCFPQFGTDGPDVMNASPYCDQVLVGLGGDDTLIGGAGNDVLWGDACRADNTGGDCKSGADALYGGGGSNVFGFNRAHESRRAHVDTIMDFVQGHDHIAVAGVCWGGHSWPCHFVGTAPFDGAGAVRYRIRHRHSTNPTTVVSIDIDGDGTPDFRVRLVGAFDLTDKDFMLRGFPPF